MCFSPLISMHINKVDPIKAIPLPSPLLPLCFGLGLLSELLAVVGDGHQLSELVDISACMGH